MSRPRHVVLLGDSTIDNELYVDGGRPVPEHLRSLLDEGDRVTMLAVDGHTSVDTAGEQIPRIPDDATHLVLSVGGNDALGYVGLLQQPVDTVAAGFALMGPGVVDFESSYRTCLEAVLEHRLPTVACTIYNGNFALDERDVIRTAVRLFNDVILQSASDRRVPVIDLRQVCADPSDYFDPIEPNDQGGRKIAVAIADETGRMG